MESRLFIFWNSGRKDRHRTCFTWLQKELSTKFNSDCNTLQVVMMDLGPDWQWSLNPEVGNEVSNWSWEMGAWWNIKQIQTCCWLQELVWSNHRAIVTQDQRSGSADLLESSINSDTEGAALSETIICLCARTSLSVPRRVTWPSLRPA